MSTEKYLGWGAGRRNRDGSEGLWSVQTMGGAAQTVLRPAAIPNFG